MPAFRQSLIWFLFFFIALNIVGLWFFQLSGRRESTEPTSVTISSPAPSIIPSSTPSPVSTSNSEVSQLNKTVTALQAQLAQVIERVTTLEEAATTINSTPTEKTTVIYISPSPTSATKEFVVYLGAGSTFSKDWTEISATTFTFEPSNYPKVKSITFEAGLSIQGGEARARLKNKTTGNSLVETEVMHNTGTSTWKWASFAPPSTGTTYVVELKSSSGEKANLDGARLKIVTY
ncbi:MAG TPA: hypothetical protein VF209_04445 [Patescibacteria group bacterium]